MEFLYGLITGCVLTVVGYLLRNKIGTYAVQEEQAIVAKVKGQPKPTVVKPLFVPPTTPPSGM